MDLKNAYNYFFYKLYKFWELVSTPRVWIEWKATLSIIILEIILAFSVLLYYIVYREEDVDIGEGGLVILLYILGIALPNYLFFLHKDRWKDSIEEFDKLPGKKHLTGRIIVASIVVAIFGNLFFLFYLMSRIRWR